MRFLALLRFVLVLLAAAMGGRAETNAPADPEAVLRQLRQTPGNPVYIEQLRLTIPAITQAPLREVSLAVYGLGCLINGEPAQAQQAREALKREFPASSSLALFNAESLTTSCPRCGGEGTLKREFCDTCKGNRRCGVCGGKGKLKALSGSASCSACNGSGRCRDCEGTGRKAAACPRCSGQGRVLDLDEIRRTSYGLLQQYLHAGEPVRERGTPGEGKRRRPTG